MFCPIKPVLYFKITNFLSELTKVLMPTIKWSRIDKIKSKLSSLKNEIS